MSTKKLGIHVKLCLFRPLDTIRIFNIKTFEHIENTESLYAVGFDEKGKPIRAFMKDTTVAYPLIGEFVSGIDLSATYSLGITISNRTVRRDAFGNVQQTKIDAKKVYGFEAVAIMLSRNGIAISPEETERKIAEAFKNGIQNVHVFKLSNTHGMDTETFAKIGEKDEWIFSGSRPESVDYDTFWNSVLLKKILKSPWRIFTKKTSKLARISIFKEATED